MSIVEQVKMDEMRSKVDNLFTNARKFCTKEDFVKTVKTVGAGIWHLVQLAGYAGIRIVGLVVMYIKQFVQWVKHQYSDAAANFAEKHLSKSTK